jgi:hypothetical protein
MYDHGIVKKPKKKTERVFEILKKDNKDTVYKTTILIGPQSIAEGGYTWQTPSE